MEPELSEKGSLEQNFRVEYVLHYSFKDGDKSEVSRQFTRLLQSLASVGLDTAVRSADESSLLVFVRAPQKTLLKAVHSARTRDWLYGVRHTQPGTDGNGNGNGSREPQTEAEHLRTIYDLITLPKEEGGAGITPKQGEWTHLHSIFPLHNHELNRDWIKSWSKKTFLSQKDLDQIRARFGEKVAFYFAFLQAYFAFLMVPAALGFCAWALLGNYSVTFAMLNSLACLVFVEAWKRQETELALRWDVKGVSAIPLRRREFKPKMEVTDPITGEKTTVFPVRERLKRQLLQIPFSLVAILALGSLIVTCFAIEIFISEIYSGPFKSILAFVPTVILSLFVPRISQVLTAIATQLNDYENYETQEEYDVSLTRKLFVLNFVTSYLPVLLTAFVYLPFAHILVPYLDVLHWFVRPLQAKIKMSEKTNAETQTATSKFTANRSRLRKQMIYFAITAQVVSFLLETVVPYVQRKVINKFKGQSGEQKKSANDIADVDGSTSARLDDIPEELPLLKRARNEAQLSNYDVTADLREMCLQFGYLALFSPVWSLVPLFFLLNNWLELRSDFIKICIECKRPTPFRADSIGPWLDSLSFLAWLGSITSTALVYLFADHDAVGVHDSGAKAWVLLLIIFVAEHGFFLVRMAVAFAFSKLETSATKKDRGQRYMLRRKYLESAVSGVGEHEPEEVAEQEVDKAETDGVSRRDLEEEARRLSMHNATPSDQFWARQRGWKEAAQVGVGFIQASIAPTRQEDKKKQ